jgi:hypothetical protein
LLEKYAKVQGKKEARERRDGHDWNRVHIQERSEHANTRHSERLRSLVAERLKNIL